MRGALRFLLLSVMLVASACGPTAVALGWRFGPGWAVDDHLLFAAPPVVVERGNEAYLVWTQGTRPFYFAPSYETRDGRLFFACAATGSSGNLAGRRREMKIEGKENLAALRRGGAVWWQATPEKITPLEYRRHDSNLLQAK